MVENVVEDAVEPKPGENKASGVGVGSDVTSSDVKPTKQVEFKVKIPFQVHIVHNKERPLPTGNFEEKPKPVFVLLKKTSGHFLQQMKDGKIEKNYLVGFVNKRLRPDLLFL